jgi:hypothetical protein
LGEVGREEGGSIVEFGLTEADRAGPAAVASPGGRGGLVAGELGRGMLGPELALVETPEASDAAEHPDGVPALRTPIAEDDATPPRVTVSATTRSKKESAA